MKKNKEKILLPFLLGVSLFVLLPGCDTGPNSGEKCADCNTSSDCHDDLVCAEFSDGKKRCAAEGITECQDLPFHL